MPRGITVKKGVSSLILDNHMSVKTKLLSVEVQREQSLISPASVTIEETGVPEKLADLDRVQVDKFPLTCDTDYFNCTTARSTNQSPVAQMSDKGTTSLLPTHHKIAMYILEMCELGDPLNE